MKSAIIGHSGFVGHNLSLQNDFSHKYNSKNIQEIKNENFDLVVCAAAPGSMFEANNFPKRDLLKINELIEILDTVQTSQFVLISSIAVFKNFAGKDDEKSHHFQDLLAYGKNRRHLEEFCAQKFKKTTILRLPALFGEGLKKNFIFDLQNPVPSMLTPEKFDLIEQKIAPSLKFLLHEIYKLNDQTKFYVVDREKLAHSSYHQELEASLISSGLSALSFHNIKTQYQFYNLDYLWRDLNIAIKYDLDVLHLATEPLQVSHVYDHLFKLPLSENSAKLHLEDMYSLYAHHFNTKGHYLVNAETTLKQLSKFIKRVKKK